MIGERRPRGGRPLPVGHDSLALGVPPSGAGTIFAQAVRGGVELRAREGRELVFGRNRQEVHVCLGADDRMISRRQGTLRHHDGHWWVSNVGKLPIRLPGSRLLFQHEEPVPLEQGYSPLFVRGTRNREHLLEVYVVGPDGERPGQHHAEETVPPRMWQLSDDERLALVVLGQRYLRHDALPQPLAWRQAGDQLADLRPDAGWNARKVERTVGAVRARLSAHGVAGLTREEVGEPVGNMLNDNLIRELMLCTTLVPPDLALLDPPGDEE